MTHFRTVGTSCVWKDDGLTQDMYITAREQCRVYGYPITESVDGEGNRIFTAECGSLANANETTQMLNLFNNFH